MPFMIKYMGDFHKIELHNPVSQQEAEYTNPTMKKRRFGKFGKFFVAFLIFIALIGVTSVFTIVLPAKKTYESAMVTRDQARKAYDAIKVQNIELASQELEKTQKSLKETQEDLQAMSYLRFIPIASWYYNDADHLIKAGFHGMDAADILLDSVKPYADVLGLKGQGSFVMGSAEQRIQTAVLTMGKITPRIDDISAVLVKARDEIDAVDPNHYPAFFGGEKLKQQLVTAQTLMDEGVVMVDEARPLIKVLPSLLGEKEPKKYLVIFQNDKELRPTGGFMTAYAIFRIEKGMIYVERSDDIYNLDNAIPNKPKAPEAIVKYLPKVSTLNLRDSNLSPDFVQSMETFESLYEKARNKVDVDGIIALDTYVLVSTIKILDDEVIAGGIKFTSKLDKRCDCPQAIYELEDNISRPVGYIKEDRKGLLGQLLLAIMQKALKSSPKIYWGPLFQNIITEMNQKHVMVYLFNKDAQSGIESLNAAGRIKPFDGDYLHINEANLGGQKSNLFVKENVTVDYKVDSDKRITKTITINYKNPYPPSDCNLERGGLCLNAPFRDWIRVYVPKGSILVDSKGSEVKVSTSEDLGKTVFDGFFVVKPLGTAKFTIIYKLPFKVEEGSPLPVLIQKQPGTAGHEYTINVNGKKVDTFSLLTDKQLKLDL